TRRQMLADELNGFLKGLVESVETSVETPLEALIAEGESQDLEFKSTLRWCLRERKTDKKLEKVTMKSIASFNNGEGGTLLIGVNDEGEIIGLEHDYSILGDSKDGFELHLRELIKKNFGETFATINVKVEFPEIEDKEICQVQIKRGLEPRFLEVADKNGNKSKKFYVRSGNSSIEMPIDEATKYINSRFFRK
ncbi:MAG: helix-turn-helix domain-containing protein, partial [Nitrospinales bacterium]